MFISQVHLCEVVNLFSPVPVHQNLWEQCREKWKIVTEINFQTSLYSLIQLYSQNNGASNFETII